jgi:hypothetical protein
VVVLLLEFLLLLLVVGVLVADLRPLFVLVAQEVGAWKSMVLEN